MLILSEGAHPARAVAIAGPIVIAAVVAAVFLINVRRVVIVELVLNSILRIVLVYYLLFHVQSSKFKVQETWNLEHGTWNLKPGTCFILPKICIS
jgi:hypothetical protein